MTISIEVAKNGFVLNTYGLDEDEPSECEIFTDINDLICAINDKLTKVKGF